MKINKFVRLDPSALVETRDEESDGFVTAPRDFVAFIRPRYGIILGAWDRVAQLGRVSRIGLVVAVKDDASEAKVKWQLVEKSYHPSPSGRRYWTQEKPFFAFAKDVADRYMLLATFSEHFSELTDDEFGAQPLSRTKESRPSDTPRGGYVYVIRSQYGFKIGKSVDVRTRTRLFAVKQPFPITVEHYAWFDDYSFAEREFHLKYHEKRLEGEWFDLDDRDIANIKSLGKTVPVVGL